MFYDWFLSTWINGTSNETDLAKAVELGFVTQAEADQIMNNEVMKNS